MPGAPVQPNFALTVTAQEAEDDLKRIRAAIRRDADAMRDGKGGGKRRKTKATPEEPALATGLARVGSRERRRVRRRPRGAP